jgi:hypothetical protein
MPMQNRIFIEGGVYHVYKTARSWHLYETR